MKKILLSLLCAASAIAPALAETKTYQLCTDLAEITNPDNEFIIVAAKQFSGNIYAVKSGGTVATVLTNQSEVPTTLTIDNTGLAMVSLKANGTYYIPFDNSTSKYWSATNSTSATFTNNAIVTSTSGQFTVSMDKLTYVVTMSAKVSTSRALFFQNATTPAFKNYATSNASADAYALPLFYKEIEIGAVNPVYSNFDEEYTISIGETHALPEITPAELNYTFEIEEGDNIISLDTKAKTFTGLAAGTAMIKFSTEAIEDKFNADEGYFMVTVDKIMPQMEFRDQIVYGKLGVGIVWEPVKIITPEDPELRGEITYTSSNPSIVEIDASSGQIYPEGILKIGEVKITATMAAKGDYAEGSASYTVVIIDPNAEIKPSTATFDFTVNPAYGMVAHSQNLNSGTYETSVKEIVSTDGYVTITFDQGNYRLWETTSKTYELRLNAASSTTTSSTPAAAMTIAVPEGYKISKIGLVASGDNKNYASGSYSPAGDTVIKDNTGSEVENSTWLTPDDQAISSVTYTVNSSADRILKIYVQYEAASSNLQSADLTFNDVINSAYMDEDAVLNAVNNPHGLDITYSIENLDEDQYTITPTEDGKNIIVNVKVPGYYSLQATSPANDTYRDGFAIMRVNVYRHLDVYVNESDTPIATNAIDTKDAVEITMAVPELANLYYQIVSEDTPAAAANSEDENQLPGFELYEDGISIDKGTTGNLNFYIANYGYKSPIRTITLQDSTSTGISEVSGGVKANEVYDLMGRKVVRPANGLYIVNGVKVRL